MAAKLLKALKRAGAGLRRLCTGGRKGPWGKAERWPAAIVATAQFPPVPFKLPLASTGTRCRAIATSSPRRQAP